MIDKFFVIIVCLIFCQCANGNLSNGFITPNFDEVESEPTKYSSSITFSRNFANCVCDLTPGVCDEKCCCDPDCSESDQSAFQTIRGLSEPVCKLPKFRLINSMKCVPKTEVTFDLLRPGLAKEINRADNLFCVYFDQSPITGQTNYFSAISDRTTESSINSALNNARRLRNPKKTDFTDSYDQQSTNPSRSTTVYKIGEQVPMGDRVGADITNNRLFTIPGPLFSSICQDQEVQYGQSITTQTCYRKITNIAACNEELNMETYYENRYISRSAIPANQFDLTSYIAVSVADGSPSGSSNIVGGNCVNGMKKASYFITFANNAITSVSVYFETQDINPPVAPSNANPLFVEQEFEVHWIQEDATIINGTLLQRSGNPGYLRGSPIKSGMEVTEGAKSAVSEHLGGLQVYSGHTCGDGGVQVVGFDQDLVTTCRYTFTLAQLKSFCENIIDDNTFSVPYITDTERSNRFGRWGNADAKNINDWISVQSTPSESPTWTEADSSCSNLGSTLKYDFIIARQGSVVNEQWRIVGVKRQRIANTWRFNPSKGTTNDFFLQWRVHFVREAEQERGQKLYPVPTLLPKLPHDIFYPFSLATGAASSDLPSYSFIFLMIIVILM